MIKIGYKIVIIIFLLVTIKLCCPRDKNIVLSTSLQSSNDLFNSSTNIKVSKDVTVENYFP